MSELTVNTLFSTRSLAVHDVQCRGECRHRSEEEHASVTQLVFPYRGVFVRHVGSESAVAEPNQLLFFNAGETYRVSHPVRGGDGCLSIGVAKAIVAELAPKSLLRDPGTPAYRRHRIRIGARAQALVALLRHSLLRGIAEPLEAEGLALTLMRRAFAVDGLRSPGGSAGRQRLADRAKLVLAGDLARRWTLAEIAAEVGVSPVYLTQVFRQVEGMPLYRYQLRLRLARALDLLGDYVDLSALGLELGFSSHSHFSAAFLQAYGRTPTEFKRAALKPRPA